MKTRILLAATALLGGYAIGASAHHAFNMYDNSKYVKLEGTVQSYSWKNPHVMIDYVVAGANGEMETWSIECSSPNIIGRRGWTPTSIKAGDKIPMVIHPMKDGRRIALTVSATLPDGTVLKDKE
ncbi:MAG: DUF6152 family protein [Steroidobacteraceae bacterium]